MRRLQREPPAGKTGEFRLPELREMDASALIQNTRRIHIDYTLQLPSHLRIRPLVNVVLTISYKSDVPHGSLANMAELLISTIAR
jgi:hypothetical protein